MKLKQLGSTILLAVASSFVFSSALINKNITINPSVEEVKADNGPIIEDNHRVIYFHVHSSWERGQAFGYDTNQWLYKYSTNGSSYQKVSIGGTDSSGNSYYKIIGDFAVKIFLPTTVTQIKFMSYDKETYSWSTSIQQLNGDYSSRQAYWVKEDDYSTSYQWTGYYDTKDADYSDGEWMSENAFLDRFYTMYFSSTNSGWVSNSSLTNAYVRCSYSVDTSGSGWGIFKSSSPNGSTRIQSSMITSFSDGTNYAKFLVPKDCNQVWLAKTNAAEDSANGNTGTFMKPMDNYLYVVTTNYTFSAQDLTFVDINKSSYVFDSSIPFARFYFSTTWSYTWNPIISKETLQDNEGPSTGFSDTGTASSYAEIVKPSDNTYFYIDYPMTSSGTSCYFRFKSSDNKNVYPTGQGYSGYIGNAFAPGYVYRLHVEGNATGASGDCLWANVTVTTVGVIAKFNNDGGTRNPLETVNLDYKEFVYNINTTLLKTPSKSGYTFQGWEPSSNAYVNKAEAGFTVASGGPVVFTAKWLSNTQMVVPSGKARLWIGYDGTVNESLFYKGSDITNLAVIKLKINDGNGTYKWFGLSGTFYNLDESISGSLGCPRRYDYFDIDQKYFENNNWYFNVLRYSSDGQTEWTTSKFYGTLSKDNVYKIYYCPSDWETSSWYDFAGLATTNSTFATLALCGMHTCDSSKYGYGGFSTFDDTFVKDSDISAGLSDYSIIDFAGTSHSYTSDDRITRTVNAYTKYLWCQYMAGGQSGEMPIAALGFFGGLLSEGESSNPLIIIIIASSISLLSVTALSILVIKKRKNK